MSQKRGVKSCPDGYRVLRTSELLELLQDEAKIDQIVHLSDKFKELQVERESFIVINQSLAEESLAQRPRLENGKLQLAAKYKELQKLVTSCTEKQNRLEVYREKHNTEAAQRLLQEEVAHVEDQSEDLLKSFMEGGVPLENFLDSFQSHRKTYHVRRAQAEKIQELKRSQRKEPSRPEEDDDGQKGKDRRVTEHLPNGVSGHGLPRVFQLRYGVTPAILVPLSKGPGANGAQSSADSFSGHPGAHARPVGLRVIGQLPGWPVRQVRLQQLYKPHQSEPPYR